LDEPTSALDASVQAQILKLLVELQRRFSLSYMLITHNIAVAAYLSDLIAVMYAGNLVEYGPTDAVLRKPRHPYTIALLKSAPTPDPVARTLLQIEIKGEVPSAIDPPSGCKFNPRCPYAEAICSEQVPALSKVTEDHTATCHFLEKTT
jgi:oligopeptide/dipeptide ABC transporter ATP-binding protein